MTIAAQKRVVTKATAVTMPACAMRASYNGNTLASQARAVGSIPIARSNACIEAGSVLGSRVVHRFSRLHGITRRHKSL